MGQSMGLTLPPQLHQPELQTKGRCLALFQTPSPRLAFSDGIAICQASIACQLSLIPMSCKHYMSTFLQVLRLLSKTGQEKSLLSPIEAQAQGLLGGEDNRNSMGDCDRGALGNFLLARLLFLLWLILPSNFRSNRGHNPPHLWLCRWRDSVENRSEERASL